MLKKDKTVVSVSGYVEADENIAGMLERLSLMLPAEAKVEVILVNDGSIDDSGNICDEYAQKYDNIE